MSRLISLAVLVVLVAVIGVLSVVVLWSFVLPLFLAAMAAVLFRPVHIRLAAKWRGRNRLAAGATAGLVLVCVLIPLLAIVVPAVSEMTSLVSSLDRDALARKIAALQNRLSLGPPPKRVMAALDELERILDRIDELPRSAELRRAAIDVPPPPDYAELRHAMAVADGTIESELKLRPRNPNPAAAPAAELAADSVAPAQLQTAWEQYKRTAESVRATPADGEAFVAAWRPVRTALAQFRTELLGGPIAAWFKRNVHLEPDQLQKLLDRARSAAGPLALDTTQYLGGLAFEVVIGIVVMLLGTYYFLADGHQMLAALMRLTPLEGKYVEGLLTEFGNLTRAVVLSMLLAAGAQGLLAGVGYFFAGLDALFLLTLTTTLFAMLPFVGATVVWGGAALWLYFIDGRLGAAVGLAIYCAVVVSLADNLIKPLVLQERSNLHPLAALLSVLGGVQALGPIGVFIGPMVLALLHTLLVMLRSELATLEKPPV